MTRHLPLLLCLLLALCSGCIETSPSTRVVVLPLFSYSQDPKWSTLKIEPFPVCLFDGENYEGWGWSYP
jgi:hypothetical protein